MKIKLLSFALMFAAAAFVASCGGSGNSASQENQEAETVEPVQEPAAPALAFNPDSVAEEPVFDIVTNYGTIRVKLFKDTPKHRDNFVKLASERFYDRVQFHRVLKDFMIQAGDPTTADTNADPRRFGFNDAGYKVPAEILPNHKHVKGALCAAREGDKANPEKRSSSSQFYIVQNEAACRHLDGDYTVFGQTIGGIDVVDKIAAVKTTPKGFPFDPVTIQCINLVTE